MTVPITDGLVVQLDAEVGVTLDGGGKVSSWQDQSGGGNDFIQSTEANRPGHGSIAELRNDVVKFDGEHCLECSNKDIVRNVGGCTVFISQMLRYCSKTYNSYYYFTSATNVDAARAFLYGKRSPIDNMGYLYSGGRTADSDALTTGVMGIKRKYDNSVLCSYVNFSTDGVVANYHTEGGYSTENITPTISNSDDTNSIYVTIGAPLYKSSYRESRFDIAEILVYDRVLTDGEKTLVTSYLNFKHNATLTTYEETTQTIQVGDGETYTDFNSALEYVVTLPEGKYILNQTSDITNVTNSQARVPAGYQIEITCPNNMLKRHDQAQWYTVSHQYDYASINVYANDLGYENSSNIKISFLKIIGNWNEDNNCGITIIGHFGYGSKVYNCLFINGSSLHFGYYNHHFSHSMYLLVSGCVFYNGSRFISSQAYHRHVYTAIVHNCTFVNGGNDISTTSVVSVIGFTGAVVYYNCSVLNTVRTTENDYTLNVSGPVYFNCYAGNTDITPMGSNNIVGITSSFNEFISTSIASPDFLKPRGSGLLIDDGSISTLYNLSDILETTDIDGSLYSLSTPMGAYVYTGYQEPQITLSSGADIIKIALPMYGYKCIVNLALSINHLSSGYEAWDNGTANDYRVCSIPRFYLPEAQAELLETFLCAHRIDDISIDIGINSGFFPFGPDKGDSGAFTVRIIKRDFGIYDQYKRVSKTIDFVLVSAPPYEITDGSPQGPFQVGDVPGLLYPQLGIDNKINYGDSHVLTLSGSVGSIDKGYIDYVSNITQQCNEGLASELMAFLSGANGRGSDIVVVAPSQYYLFGFNNSEHGTYTCKLISGEINCTHVGNEQFEISFKIWMKEHIS